MPNVTRGTRMHGLMAYLTGPGRANEHTFPHLVTGEGMVMSWFGSQELTTADGHHVAQHLNAPSALGEVEVEGGHVWHCSLSLPASEGELSDERWAAIAQDFMEQMAWRVSGQRPAEVGVLAGAGGGPQEPAGAGVGTSRVDARRPEPAALRWVAVRHGLSKNGNDHVHLVVNLVSEDGRVAGTFNDFRRAQAAARVLEKKHGLVQLASATRGVASRGWKPAELEAAARRTAVAGVEHARRSGAASIGWAEMDGAARKAAIVAARSSAAGPLGKGLGQQQPRRVLELAVRGAATASRTEGEFVRRLRDAGLLVRPRFEAGSSSDEQAVVSGFSVALRPQFGAGLGERPVWFGGGTLARDLTLPRLRGGWEQGEQSRAAAVSEWTAAARGRRCATAPAQRRERKVFSPSYVVAHARKVSSMRERLAQVPAGNRPLWAKVAASSAGTLSAWAMEAARSSDAETARLAPMLAAAAQVMSHSAQTVRPAPSSFEAGTTSMSGMAMLLASAARGGRGAVGQAVLMAQMIALVEAVAAMAAARRELDLARDLRVQVQGQLATISSALEGRRGRDGLPAAPAAWPATTRATTRPTTRPTAGPAADAVAQRAAAPESGQQPGAERAASTVAPERARGADPLAWLAAWRAHLEATHGQSQQGSASGAGGGGQVVQRRPGAPSPDPRAAGTGGAGDATAKPDEKAVREQRRREAAEQAERRRRDNQRGGTDRGGPQR